MRVSDWLWLVLGTTFAVGIAGVPLPVQAQEQRCDLLPEVVARLESQSVRFGVIEGTAADQFVFNLEARIGFNFPPVTSVLIADLGPGIFYGLVIDGCLTAPTVLHVKAPPRQSGMTPAGVFA